MSLKDHLTRPVLCEMACNEPSKVTTNNNESRSARSCQIEINNKKFQKKGKNNFILYLNPMFQKNGNKNRQISTKIKALCVQTPFCNIIIIKILNQTKIKFKIKNRFHFCERFLSFEFICFLF